AEVRAGRALESEVARVREEAEARLAAAVGRVRQEAEDARLVGQTEAHLEAEKIREAAACEARAIAEAAANRTLDAEIQRVRAEAGGQPAGARRRHAGAGRLLQPLAGPGGARRRAITVIEHLRSHRSSVRPVAARDRGEPPARAQRVCRHIVVRCNGETADAD